MEGVEKEGEIGGMKRGGVMRKQNRKNKGFIFGTSGCKDVKVGSYEHWGESGAHRSIGAGIHWIVRSHFSIVICTNLHTHKTKTPGYIEWCFYTTLLKQIMHT